MESLRNDRMATVDLTPFKRFGIYQLLDPKSPKIFNYNAYRFFHTIYLIGFSCVAVLTAMTLFMDDNIDYSGLGVLFFMYTCGVSSMINISVFLYKADTIWSLFDVIRTDFLQSRACCKYVNNLYEYYEKSTKITNTLFRFFTAIYFLWMFHPITLNMFRIRENSNQYYENIFNIKFPVSACTYNRYYFVFYLIEIVFETFLFVNTTIINIFLITFYLTIIAQYEVLAHAFEDLGHEDNRETFLNKKENDNIEDLKQILSDHTNVHIKLKTFYSIIWIIIGTHVVLSSGTIISLVYSSILIYMSDSFYTIVILKINMAILVFVIDLLSCCYLCELMNEKVEAVNFGLYSCNWTEMDLKFKKLILMAMRMNDANKLKMKISPTKLVNLQFLATVIKITYNIINLLLKKLTIKSENSI